MMIPAAGTSAGRATPPPPRLPTPAGSAAHAAPAELPSAVEPILKADLSAGYGKTLILDELSFALAPGEVLGVIGSSGAGKSTLLLALLGLLSWKGGWARGSVAIGGEDLLRLPERRLRHLRGNRFALIPQSPLSALNPVLSVRAQLEHAWRAHAPGGSTKDFQTRMEELFAAVQLPLELAPRRASEISVGQAQRVLIAMALLHRPALLLADEPTSALDPVTQSEIVRLLRTLQRENGTAMLYISHDLASVMQLCDRAVVLDGGKIVESLTVAGFEDEASHPATLRLLSALPAPPAVLRSYARGPR